MISRVNDVLHEHRQILLPIEGYQDTRLMSLDEAVEPLISLFPENSLLTNVWIVKERCKAPADDLSQDESASIMLYTLEWLYTEQSLYFILNQTLRIADRNKLKPWFPYLRLFIGALLQLPAITDPIYRGVKRDLKDEYTLNSSPAWWGFSSCTDTIQVLQSEQFFGRTGPRTMFHIKCVGGRNIRKHSFHQRENEILLMPGRYFQVRGHLDINDELNMIQLEEIEPPHLFLKLPEIHPWRRIAPGASLLGKCTNLNCDAHRREVIIPTDWRKFDVVADILSLARCPMCANYAEISKLGFNNCQWRIYGIKQTNNSQSPSPFSTDWSQAPRNSLFEYTLEQEETNWRQIIVETKPEKSP